MKFKFFLPGIIWLIVSFVLLTLPGDDLPHNKFFDIPYFDKYIHFSMFFMLTVLFSYPFAFFRDDQPVVKGWFTKVAVSVVLYGIIMEFVQKVMANGRSFDVVDIVFDTLGSLTGLVAMLVYYGKKIGPNRNRGRNQN